jgi:DUF1680 family protein
LAIGVIATPLAGAAEPAEIVRVAQPFPLDQVTLLSDGPFFKASQINLKYLRELDADRMLWPFHERAGLPVKGERYGGWEQKDVVGSMTGHYLSALSLQSASARNENKELKGRVDYMVAEIAKAQAKHGNGYAGPVRTEVWDETFSGEFRVHKWGLAGGYVPWYVLHKTFAGLLDAFELTGNEQALEVACKFADWAKAGTDKLSDAQFQKMLQCEYGGMGDAMARLYAATGNRDYLALAKRFDHQGIFAPLAAQRDELAGKHVNTQMPKIIGAARLYELTGEERYATIARYFWDTVVSTRSFAPGGVDFHEHFKGAGEEAKHLNWDSTETCVTHNMLKLTRQLFGWKPEARYMDYYERALYNHILGSQDPESGGVCYFYSLRPGHFKTYSMPFDSMWCCVGTGIENHSKYGDTIFYHDDDSLWVNLFIPSKLNWKEKGATITQETNFPQEDSTTLTIDPGKEQELSIKIRIPYWATKGVEVKINGKREQFATTPQSYLTITRVWKGLSKIEVRFPMSLHLYRARDDEKLGVIMYGPLVLAGELGKKGMPEKLTSANNKQYSGEPVPPVPVLVTDGKDPASWMVRTDPKTLRFKTQKVGQPGDVTLVPLHQLHHQRYTVYWKLLTQSEWLEAKGAREAEERDRKQLETRTVDYVTPDAKLERAHNQQGETTYSGAAFGRKWRDARGGGWFSYDLKVLPNQPVSLMVTYWGGDVGNRVFDLLANDKKFATQKLNNLKPGEFVDVTYELPAELTKGKEKVTIKFQAHSGAMAGGAFGCRVVRKSE